MGDEIRITYETLFDLVRREKSREELQKLDASFLADAEAYLTEKHSIASGPNESFFSDEERQKTLLQLANSCKLLRELYERREKKIIAMAMIKARQEKALLDTAAMLSPERELFEKLVAVLKEQRQAVLDPLASIGALLPSHTPLTATKIALEQTQPLKTAGQPNLSVEFLADVPKFVGKSLEIYGPYTTGQHALLPAEIAKILIDKGRAKEAAAPDSEEMDLGNAEEPIEAPQ